MIDFHDIWVNNIHYFDTLQFLASLSSLFANGEIPYLDYRLAENVFCNSFNAQNDARACIAYDAHIDDFGIGIKTFTLRSNSSTEKIAEFNRLKSELDLYNGIELAKKLADYRNDRIAFADNSMGISQKIYKYLLGYGYKLHSDRVDVLLHSTHLSHFFGNM